MGVESFSAKLKRWQTDNRPVYTTNQARVLLGKKYPDGVSYPSNWADLSIKEYMDKNDEKSKKIVELKHAS